MRLINIIPQGCYYRLKLLKLKINSRKTFKEKEKIIDSMYYQIIGSHINWSKPEKYTEKINFSKLYNSSAEKTLLSDKYLVRKWIENKIGAEYLIPLLGVYDKFEEIDFDQLPNEFVIKCNHDSMSTTIVKDKNSINIKKLQKKYEYYLKCNYAWHTYEMQYEDIKPRIIIEKLMDDGHKDLQDYKFLCFNGIPFYCWVDVDRFGDHKRNIYDMSWELVPFCQVYSNTEEPIKKPDGFETMKTIATTLSKGFDHVRVDLYNIHGKIYFGEMTFTNGSGFEKIIPHEWDKKLGDLWDLDLVNRINHFQQ